jgi:hypothetical protein
VFYLFFGVSLFLEAASQTITIMSRRSCTLQGSMLLATTTLILMVCLRSTSSVTATVVSAGVNELGFSDDLQAAMGKLDIDGLDKSLEKTLNMGSLTGSFDFGLKACNNLLAKAVVDARLSACAKNALGGIKNRHKLRRAMRNLRELALHTDHYNRLNRLQGTVRDLKQRVKALRRRHRDHASKAASHLKAMRVQVARVLEEKSRAHKSAQRAQAASDEAKFKARAEIAAAREKEKLKQWQAHMEKQQHDAAQQYRKSMKLLRKRQAARQAAREKRIEQRRLTRLLRERIARKKRRMLRRQRREKERAERRRRRARRLHARKMRIMRRKRLLARWRARIANTRLHAARQRRKRLLAHRKRVRHHRRLISRLLARIARQRQVFGKKIDSMRSRHRRTVRALRKRHRKLMGAVHKKYRAKLNAIHGKHTLTNSQMRARIKALQAKHKKELHVINSGHSSALKKIHDAYKPKLAALRRIHRAALRKLLKHHAAAVAAKRASWLRHVRNLKARMVAALRAVSRRSCHSFWKSTGNKCPKGFKRNIQRMNWICKGQNCLRRCCKQVDHTCSSFYLAHGCPAGYRPSTGRHNKKCKNGNCWSRCCENARVGDGACRSWGDPHVITFDRNYYDCQVTGEVLYYDNPTYDEKVHVLQVKSPYGGYPTYVHGMAFQTGGNVFSLRANNPHSTWWNWVVEFQGRRIGGVGRNSNKKFGPFHVRSHGNYVQVVNTLTRTMVRWWYARHHRRVWYWDIDIVLPFRPGKVAHRGVCGVYDRNRNNDRKFKNGHNCGGHGINCCRSWLVPRSQSLFGRPPRNQHKFHNVNIRQLCGRKLQSAFSRCSKVSRNARQSCMVEFCSAKGSHERAKALAAAIKETKKEKSKHAHKRICLRMPISRGRTVTVCKTRSQWTRWRKRRHRLRVKGTCAMVRNNRGCPRGWTDRGIIGVIMQNGAYSRYNLGGGGRFNSGWRWTHPRLCCANSRRARMRRNMHFMAKACPRGTTDRGYIGTIVTNGSYKNARRAGAHGGRFNSGWRWLHPRLCQVRRPRAVSHRKLKKHGGQVCMYAARCPAGYATRGRAGHIVMNRFYSRVRAQGFHHGGRFNGGWRWSHPVLCCARG